MPTSTSKSTGVVEPLNAPPIEEAPRYVCANCQEPLIGRTRSATRGPDCAWCGQCARCAKRTKDQLEVVEDRPDGQFIQILECRRCGAARACRPGWTTRCHICTDERTSAETIEGWMELYGTIGSDSELTADQMDSEVREYADLSVHESITDRDRAEYAVALLVEEEIELRERTGWTLLATDLYGLPWWFELEPRGSHGTWARHDVCGKVQKLDPGRGRTECRHCPPDPESRTHRARAGDRHLLYLVRLGRLQKFGHGDEGRVRTHLRGGAQAVQVIEATHAEVVAAELTLKRRHNRRLRVRRQRRLPDSFGTGTEVLPISIAIDLTTVLSGVDVTYRFDGR